MKVTQDVGGGGGGGLRQRTWQDGVYTCKERCEQDNHLIAYRGFPIKAVVLAMLVRFAVINPY